MADIIYKICPEVLWREAEKAGRFDGAPVDLADGYLHFSTAEQVGETAAKHFAGQRGLLLVAVDAASLGGRLFQARMLAHQAYVLSVPGTAGFEFSFSKSLTMPMKLRKKRSM